MKPEEQRIAIAEACGWTLISTVYKLYKEYALPEGIDPNVDGLRQPLPDYLNDLNAMHEAEKELDRQQWEHYSNLLTTAVEDGDCMKSRVDARYKSAHATAAQRAEAFLKTIGKWEEEKKLRNKRPLNLIS